MLLTRSSGPSIVRWHLRGLKRLSVGTRSYTLLKEAVLSQGEDGGERLAIPQPQTHRAGGEIQHSGEEMLGYEVGNNLSYYLLRCSFTLCSDRDPLQWLHRMKDTNPSPVWYLTLPPFRGVEWLPWRVVGRRSLVWRQATNKGAERLILRSYTAVGGEHNYGMSLYTDVCLPPPTMRPGHGPEREIHWHTFIISVYDQCHYFGRVRWVFLYNSKIKTLWPTSSFLNPLSSTDIAIM